MKKTLIDFGYAFNKQGQLCQLDSNNEITDFKFQFKDQSHYEALGEVINEHVYELLEKEGLVRLYFPDNVSKEKASFVFCTKENISEINKLMIIIHGSGVVRAGQWARSLIINDSLEKGTILPYIKKATENGFDVLVTNTNERREGSSSPEKHAEAVWKKFVQPSAAKLIAIVAHSYGGVVTTNLASKLKTDFSERVFAIAFTDSVHGSRGIDKHLINVGVNFVSSEAPLNAQVKSYSGDIERRSAGTTKHEMTSYQCIDKLFEFIAEKEEEIKKKKSEL